MFLSSTVSPDQDMATTTSSGTIMPRSPWLASAGWTKKAGVPVDASVAATLAPICAGSVEGSAEVAFERLFERAQARRLDAQGA